MNVSVLTPDQELYAGPATAVTVPGANGQMQILNNHAALVSALQAGTVKVKKDNGETISYNIEKGFVEVLKNEVSVLVQGVTE